MKIIEPFNSATGKFRSLYGCRNAIFLAALDALWVGCFAKAKSI
jgi:hypothetical protein